MEIRYRKSPFVYYYYDSYDSYHSIPSSRSPEKVFHIKNVFWSALQLYNQPSIVGTSHWSSNAWIVADSCIQLSEGMLFIPAKPSFVYTKPIRCCRTWKGTLPRCCSPASASPVHTFLLWLRRGPRKPQTLNIWPLSLGWPEFLLTARRNLQPFSGDCSLASCM